MNSKVFQFYQSMQKVIVHTQLTSVMETLENSIERVENNLTPQNFMLLGETGMGKTTSIKSLQKIFPSYELEDRTIIPILKVNVPSAPTVKSLAEKMLIELGDPRYAYGTATAKTNRIFELVSELKVRMLVFDEIHHFVDHGNKNSARDVGYWLKSLLSDSDVLKASVVLVK